MLIRFDRAGAALRDLYRRFTLNQITLLMGVLGVVFILSTASFIIWNERKTLVLEAEEHAERSTSFLADHAQRLFEVADIALRATQAAMAGKDWAEIEASPHVRDSMVQMDTMLPYVSTIMLADKVGRVRVTTLDASSTYSIADRQVFKDAQSPGDRLLIGDPIVGRVSHQPTFIVARRLEDPDGTFRGIVAVSMSLTYFTNYWRNVDIRNDEQIRLIRDQTGSLLAAYPEALSARGDHLGPDVVVAAGDGAASGEVRPSPHELGFYRRVGALPTFVSVVFKDAVISAVWRQWAWSIAPFVIGAIVVLVGIMGLGRRLAIRETRIRHELEAARMLLGASNIRLEQRVAERTADLQETNDEIQRFAYIVSHDLRAPLVNIMGFTSELEGLRSDLFVAEAASGPVLAPPRRVREDFDEAIGFIKTSIDKMDRLINAILALSRQGQRKFRPEPLDMDLLMRSIADGVAHRLQQGGATIAIGPLPPIVADRIAIEQVFSNLVDNAVKYLERGRPGRIDIGAQASATTVTFEIRDNGRGIDAKDRERVFDLFRRAGAQDRPGEGIGLANVRSLIRRLQGTIRLDSTLGVGSVFIVTLPKFDAASEDAPS